MSLECSGGCSAARSFSTVAYTCVVKFPVFTSHKECLMLSFSDCATLRRQRSAYCRLKQLHSDRPELHMLLLADMSAELFADL